MKNIILNQFRGLGDILFIEPIARHYYKLGHRVIIPVVPEYSNLSKYFPYITFLHKNLLNIDYERRTVVEDNQNIIIPLRWSMEIYNSPWRDVMKNKYKLVDLPWEKWRELKWMRDLTTENKLYNKLGLKDEESYNLVNEIHSTQLLQKHNFKIENGLKNVKLQVIEGYTLLDWYKVIQCATTIHSVHTSINYLIEVIPTKAETMNQLHMYSRTGREVNFREYMYLFNKQYHKYKQLPDLSWSKI
jgi:hypothetical protein